MQGELFVAYPQNKHGSNTFSVVGRQVRNIRGVPHGVLYCRKVHNKNTYGVDEDLGDHKETVCKPNP